MRKLLVILLMFWSAASVAGSMSSYTSYDAALAACKAFNGGGSPNCTGSSGPYQGCPSRNVYVFLKSDAGGNYSNLFCYVQACPAGEEDVKGKCLPKCAEGETRGADGQCSGPCKAGEKGVGTWFLGVSSSPGSLPATFPSGAMCDGQCQIDYENTGPDSVVDCVTTAGKPYPKGVWCSYTGKKNGKTCSYGDGSLGNGGIEPKDDDAVCPNGVCTPSSGDGTAGQNTDHTSNGGADASTKTCANGATDYPACTTPRTGNGSTGGVTPTTVTVSQIDEGGVATGVDRGAGGADLEAQTKERKDAFSDQTKVGELPWKFTFSLPSNSCHSLKFGVFGREHSFDVCPWLSMVREGLGYLIYFLTSLYIWRSLTGAVGASGAK